MAERRMRRVHTRRGIKRNGSLTRCEPTITSLRSAHQAEPRTQSSRPRVRLTSPVFGDPSHPATLAPRASKVLALNDPTPWEYLIGCPDVRLRRQGQGL